MLRFLLIIIKKEILTFKIPLENKLEFNINDRINPKI